MVGVIMAGVMYDEEYVWREYVWWGLCMVGVMYGGDDVWWGDVWW